MVREHFHGRGNLGIHLFTLQRAGGIAEVQSKSKRLFVVTKGFMAEGSDEIDFFEIVEFDGEEGGFDFRPAHGFIENNGKITLHAGKTWNRIGAANGCE